MRRADVGKTSSDQSHLTGSGDDRRLPTGWRWVELGELVESMKNGLYKPASQYADDGIACLRMYNIEGGRIVWRDVKRMRLTVAELEDYRLLPGDLLLNRVNSRELVGKSALIPSGLEPSVFESKNIRLRVRRELVDPAFLNYRLLEAGSQYFNRNAQQVVGMASISQPQVARFLVPLPSLDRQREIVAQLDAQFTRLDAGVAGLDHVRVNLVRYRAAVLKAACEGRLVPSESELARRDGRSYETGDDLLSGLLAERRARSNGRRAYKEPSRPDLTALPHLPNGWAWSRLDQLGRVHGGLTKNPRRAKLATEIPYLRVANVYANELRLDDIESIGVEDSELPKLLVRAGDLLIVEGNGSRQQIGRLAIWDGSIDPCVHQNHLIKVRLLEPLIGKWILYWLLSPAGRGFVEVVASSTSGLYTLSVNKVADLSIAIPPLREQKRLVEEVERRFSVADALKVVAVANLRRTSRLRAAILHKAFSGRLSVASRPAIVQPATVSPQRRHFARAVLSAEIVTRLHREPTFGRIKHQKIFHLCEHVARLGEIQGEYHREAAGPLDNRLVYANEAELKKQHWFKTVRRDGHGHSYEPMSKAGGHRKYAERYWPDQLRAIERLIEQMRTWKTDRCEIFSTVYAAWNDLILWQRPVTDDAIVHEILNRWHSAKRQIAETRWRKAIQWVRENGFEPTGFGHTTASPE